MSAFQERYRQADVLLVDDLQFMAGRERTQEVFLQTFNALYEAKKQIVLSSDKPPQDIAPLAARLRSRLTAGLMADLQPPDLETRLAILDKKASAHGIVLPPGVAMLIASRVRTNISDLEQCLARIATYASLHTQSIDESLAEMVLQQAFAERRHITQIPAGNDEHIRRFPIELLGHFDSDGLLTFDAQRVHRVCQIEGRVLGNLLYQLHAAIEIGIEV